MPLKPRYCAVLNVRIVVPEGPAMARKPPAVASFSYLVPAWTTHFSEPVNQVTFEGSSFVFPMSWKASACVCVCVCVRVCGVCVCVCVCVCVRQSQL